MAVGPGRSLTFEELAALRGKTEAVARFLQSQLKSHLETLRQLFAPSRLLGHYARSDTAKDTVFGADKALAQLHQQYQTVSATPFALPPQMDDGKLAAIDTRLELYPWEYTQELQADGQTKQITMTSPVRWILSYPSSYSLPELRQSLSARDRRPDDVAHFVINALVLNAVVAKFPGIAQLFNDLRYTLRTERAPGLGELPLVTVSSCISSFRPPDDLIAAATRLSGVPAFIELIDVDAVDALQDDLKQRIQGMLR